MLFLCWKCGEPAEIAPDARVGARDTCSRCDADLHACRNCQFYDPTKNHQCSEPQAEWVRDKEAANYCDYFRPRPAVRATRSGGASDAKKKFDSLFKA